jgi:hypothetical protein
MASQPGHPPSLTGSDVDALAWQFLNSAYAEDTYSDWSLERRLGAFLSRRGLSCVAEDGDACGMVLNRVMAHIGLVHHPIRES